MNCSLLVITFGYSNKYTISVEPEQELLSLGNLFIFLLLLMILYWFGGFWNVGSYSKLSLCYPSQIMDPKMDSGMIGKYYSVDEAIECGAAPVPFSFDKTVDVQCSIDIMDHLLACEVISKALSIWIFTWPKSI